MTESQPSGPAIRATVAVFAIAAIVAGIVSTVVFIALDRYDGSTLQIVSSERPTIAVEMRGAVASPGVVTLPAGARLVDAVTAAGGLGTDADTDSLNLAARVGDGEAVIIPRRLAATPAAQTPASPGSGSPLNINSASIEELDRLPGIGPVIGERIVTYREANGPFRTVDEITAVDGISENLLEELRPLITVDD